MTPQTQTAVTERRRRRLLPKVVLGGVTILLCLAIGEVGLRAYVAARGWTPNCYAAQLELFRPDPDNGYDLRPGFQLKSGRFQIAIDQIGLRGPGIATAKPVGVKRIAVVGESAAFGYFVSDGQEAARLLEKKFRLAGQQVEVINAGVPGYGLRQVVRRFRNIVMPLQPDIVIAYLGWNDLPSITSDDPNAERFERLPIANSLERFLGHSTLYGFVAYRLRGPVRLAPSTLERTEPTPAGIARFRADLNDLATAVEESGAQLFVCSQAMAAHPDSPPKLTASLGSTLEVVNAMIALGRLLHLELSEFASRRGLNFIDAYRSIPPDPALLGDYVHLTDAGEHRLADIWFNALAVASK